MKNLKQIILLSSVISTGALAASFSLTGNYRVGANLLNNLDLRAGVPNGTGATTSFLEHRFLLNPDVVIDDRFAVRSELLFQNASLDTKNSSPEAFGSSLGSASNQPSMLQVRRTWLEWANDFGLVKFGRMPKHWGLGLLYDAGSEVLDDAGTTVDRVVFSGLIGNLALDLSYEKESEALINNDTDDSDVYEIGLSYGNPETQSDVGLLFSRKVRALGYRTDSGRNKTYELSVFSRKKWAKVQLAGEVVAINEEDRKSSSGLLLKADYFPGQWSFGWDLGLASGGSGQGFVFHSNIRPFLILFRQSVGSFSADSVRGSAANSSAVGSTVSGGNGAIFSKLGATYAFATQKTSLGFDLGYALLGHQGSAPGTSLGTEFDAHLTQTWYANFKTVSALGLLLPGKAFGDGAQAAWGLMLRGVLDF